MVTDSFGRKIDFRNTIIILTSNVGADSIKRQSSLGFNAMADSKGDFEGMKAKIEEVAKKHFRPEFLNRLDEMVVFHMLEKIHLNEIVDLEVKKLVERLAEKEIELILDKSARELIVTEGYDPEYGARPMRRAVERFLEDPLAEALLASEVKEGDVVTASVKKKDGEITFKSKKKVEKPEKTAK